jgi:hypothetical protein
MAAHSTIVAASFFDVLSESLGKEGMKQLTISETERQLLTAGARKGTTEEYYEALYHSEIPSPSPSYGFQENLGRVSIWIQDLIKRADDFYAGLTAGHALTAALIGDFHNRVLDRYQSYYLSLAGKVPEFAIWAILQEHAVAHSKIDALCTQVRNALNIHDHALAQIGALLAVEQDETVITIGRHRDRDGLRKVNVGALAKPIVPRHAGNYGTQVLFPTTERAFLTPHYQIAINGQTTQPADENWWQTHPVMQDIEVMLATYFTSADATRVPMLLLGHPGAGKSILTRVLAARLPPEEYTVIRVPLRNVMAGSPIVDQIQQALDAMPCSLS